MSKGQVSFFIVVGVILLIIAGSFIIFSKTQSQKDENTVSEGTQKAVETLVETCIETIGTEGIYRIGLQGGYHDGHSNDIAAIEVPYYWDKGRTYVPSIEEIEFEISKYMLQNIDKCLNNLSGLKGLYDIENGSMIVSSEINDYDVLIRLRYPITIDEGKSTQQMEEFEGKINLPIMKAYRAANEFIEEQKDYPQDVIIGFASTLGYKENFKVETVNMGSESVMYTIIIETQDEQKPFVYSYMARYSWDKEVEA